MYLKVVVTAMMDNTTLVDESTKASDKVDHDVLKIYIFKNSIYYKYVWQNGLNVD